MKNRLLFVLIALFSCKAQTDKQEPRTNLRFADSTQAMNMCCNKTMPAFPGGVQAMGVFLKKHLTYLKACLEVSGKVIVNFTVSETGKINGIKIAKGLTKEFDEEVVRVVALMPDWIPGNQCGKPTSFTQTLPVRFSNN